MKEQSIAEWAQKLILMQELGITEKEVDALLEKRERLMGKSGLPLKRNLEYQELERDSWRNRNEDEFQECCWNCRFFLSAGSENKPSFVCRRRAPIPYLLDLEDEVKDVEAVWPGTETEEWCGDFEINPKCLTPAPEKKPETES